MRVVDEQLGDASPHLGPPGPALGQERIQRRVREHVVAEHRREVEHEIADGDACARGLVAAGENTVRRITPSTTGVSSATSPRCRRRTARRGSPRSASTACAAGAHAPATIRPLGPLVPGTPQSSPARHPTSSSSGRRRATHHAGATAGASTSSAADTPASRRHLPTLLHSRRPYPGRSPRRPTKPRSTSGDEADETGGATVFHTGYEPD